MTIINSPSLLLGIINKGTLFLLKLYFLLCSIYLMGQKQTYIDSLKEAFENNKTSLKKYNTLTAIQSYYMHEQIDSTEKYMIKMRDFAERENHATFLLASEFNLANHYYMKGENKKAKALYRKVLKLYQKFNSPLDASSAMLNISMLESDEGNYKKAIQLVDSVTHIAEVVKNYEIYSNSKKIKGHYFCDLGQYDMAMDNYTEALRVLDSFDSRYQSKLSLLACIGKIQLKLENYPQAAKTFKSLLADQQEMILKTDSIKYLQGLGDCYRKQRQYTKALFCYSESLDLAKSSKIPADIVKINAALGKIYCAKKKYPKAIEYFNNALKEDSIISINQKVEYTAYLGKAYMRQGKYNIAKTYLNDAIHTADSIGLLKEFGDALLIRSRMYERSGDLKHAIADLKKSQKINDSIINKEKAQQANTLQIVYETQKKESEIVLQKEKINTLTERAKVDKLSKSLYAGGMFAFISISGLIYIGFHQRIKKNKLAREKQEVIYKNEIEFKQKELASQTLHLVKKNTFITELIENLEKLKQNPEHFKTGFRRIIMLLKRENASDKDWEIFKTYFSEVHNDFDEKLKTVYPEISEKEVRLAASLRMSLSTKEIAATMNVLPESILTSKYRLKKKLGLGKETDLTRFLSTL